MKNIVSSIYRKGFLLVILSLAYPPVFLFSKNIYFSRFSEVASPLVLIFFATLFIWFSIFFLIKNIEKTSLATSMVVLLFFAFNQIFTFSIKVIAKYMPTLGIEYGWAVWFMLLIFLFALVVHLSAKRVVKALLFLTNALLVAWIIMVVNIGFVYATDRGVDIEQGSDNKDIAVNTIANLPDVYYIISDGHARSDILQEVYGVDNTEFIDFLKNNNFFIAEDSTANYSMTVLSVFASLNMEYIEPRTDGVAGMNNFIEKLRNSKVRSFFEDLGYSFISFSTGFSPTELVDADFYLISPDTLTEYQTVLLGMTPLDVLSVEVLEGIKAKSHSQRVLYSLKILPELANNPNPKFVFVHIVSPHPPFIFDKDGNFLTQRGFYSMNDGSDYRSTPGKTKDDYVYGYSQQIQYFDKQLQKSLEGLLSNITRPSIIIVQSDHGPGSSFSFSSLEKSDLPERYSILNAYYFYDYDYSKLYSEITPVNSFRIILSQYFSNNQDIIEDKNFYSTSANPFDFVELEPGQLVR